MRRTLIISACLLLLSAITSGAQEKNTLHYGPDALPVPDISDGRLPSGVEAQLSGDLFYGRAVPGQPDWTEALSFALRIPLWSDRACLGIWGQAGEFYQSNAAVQSFRGADLTAPDRGSVFTGNLYVSAEMLLLRETQCRPAIVLRSVLKTASEPYDKGRMRYFDVPGYFFDIAAGKSFGPFRISVSTGFLCWQASGDTQNDAVMYGIQASWEKDAVAASLAFGGYKGWIGGGDSPMSIKARLALGKGQVRPFAYFQYGIKDYPFTQMSLGVAVGFWD